MTHTINGRDDMRAHPGSVFLGVVGVFVLQRESERLTERNECARGVEAQKWAAKPNNQRSLDGAERPFPKRLIRFYRTLLQKKKQKQEYRDKIIRFREHSVRNSATGSKSKIVFVLSVAQPAINLEEKQNKNTLCCFPQTQCEVNYRL